MKIYDLLEKSQASVARGLQAGNEFVSGVLCDQVHTEPSLAHVLDTRPKVIDFVIDNHESVVRPIEGMQPAVFIRILCVVCAECLLHFTGAMDVADIAVNGSCEIGANAHPLKNVTTDIVIDEDNPTCGAPEESFNKHEGIEHLTFEEDSELGFEGAVLHTVKYLVYACIGVVYPLVRQYQLTFHEFQSLKDARIADEKPTHGSEGSHNTNACI